MLNFYLDISLRSTISTQKLNNLGQSTLCIETHFGHRAKR